MSLAEVKESIIKMTIEQRLEIAALLKHLERADDPAVEHAREGMMKRLGGEVGDDDVALDPALDPQPLLVGGAAAEADVARGEAILEAARVGAWRCGGVSRVQCAGDGRQLFAL